MKAHDASAYIHSLIAEGEHIHQDFKFEISDSRKIARTLSAFSNTDGGRLLIGVKDNGNIAGVRSEEEIYMIDTAASIYCCPEVNVGIERYMADGRQVLVVQVPPAPAKPVMVRNSDGRRLAYVRIADENILATAVHIGAWKCAAMDIPHTLNYTAQEREILDTIASGNGLTFQQICRRTAVPGKNAVRLLSLLVHWGIIEICHDGHNFLYSAKR